MSLIREFLVLLAVEFVYICLYVYTTCAYLLAHLIIVTRDASVLRSLKESIANTSREWHLPSLKTCTQSYQASLSWKKKLKLLNWKRTWNPRQHIKRQPKYHLHPQHTLRNQWNLQHRMQLVHFQSQTHMLHPVHLNQNQSSKPTPSQHPPLKSPIRLQSVHHISQRTQHPLHPEPMQETLQDSSCQ